MYIKKYLLPVLLIWPLMGQAQDWKEQVQAEVHAITLKEQAAFKAGDCATVLSYMADHISFYANGKPPAPKAVIGKFCENIPRPFGELNAEELSVHVLTKESAYVVRKLDFVKQGTRFNEVVTKIWNKIEGNWQIVHLHSTVKEVPL